MEIKCRAGTCSENEILTADFDDLFVHEDFLDQFRRTYSSYQ